MAFENLTITFEVRDSTGRSVSGGPRQLSFEADSEELARDHYAELKNVFATDYVEDWQEKSGTIAAAAAAISESFEALGATLSRAIRKILREHYSAKG